MIKIVGIGDLVIDYYYKDNKLIGVNGGKTTSNIIFNLAYLGNTTAMFGVCGNDILGAICIDSLKQMGVDVANVDIKDINTRQFHINITEGGQITKKRCPICNNKNWYESSEIDISTIINKLSHTDIIVIDDLNDKIISVIQQIKNKIMLDLGYYQLFESLSNEEIISLLNYPYEIINMNERVAKYLINRLKLLDSLELYRILKTRLLIITKGKNGADFVYNNNLYYKKLYNISNEVDPNGAGDMFFASTINDYIKNNFTVDENFINRSFKKATNLTKEVVKVIGSRSYYQDLYKVLNVSKCTCNNIKVSISKKEKIENKIIIKIK